MPVYFPDYSGFEGHHASGKTQIVHTKLPSDLETPVSAYLKLCGNQPHSFLLESVEGGATLGRYSVIGYDPDYIWSCKRGEQTLASLKQAIADTRIDIVPENLPPMAASGLFGYIGYDMIRMVEDIPDTNPDDLGIPESVLIRPKILAVFDNVYNEITLITPVYDTSGPARQAYDDACARLEKATNALNGPLTQTNTETQLAPPLAVASNTTREEYHDMVKKAVEYIKQGEIFQAVPGQRFSVPFDLPAFELYRCLRTLNPSPFMVHMSFDGFSLVASSPEILVRVRDNTVTIRPIAGTRKRGQTPQEDKALAEDLLSDPKERAEHLMLLDLGRNDVGRVAEFGTVNVTEQFTIEYYSHVMHIVSNVEGTLRKDMDIIDAHFSGFPAGTVSGAPKIRAMEIIDELEKSRRGFYAGSMGYFAANGTMDTCITLRTGLVKDGTLYVQAGGGVVADSDPAFEYQESVNKSKALIRAAEMAIERAQTK